MSTWGDHARAAILKVHRALPAETPLEARIAAVDAAYPFGDRSRFPYKAWLRERRAYLRHYGYTGRRSAGPTPLDLLPRDPVTGRPVTC